MQTKVPRVKLTHWGSLVVQSAHFLLLRCKARSCSSGDSCVLRRFVRGAGRLRAAPGAFNMARKGELMGDEGRVVKIRNALPITVGLGQNDRS